MMVVVLCILCFLLGLCIGILLSLWGYRQAQIKKEQQIQEFYTRKQQTKPRE